MSDAATAAAAERRPPAALTGVFFMIGAVTVFAVQDGLSKHLVERYPSIFVVMIRYWVFAAFVIALSAARPGGLRAAIRTKRPALQILRGLLLVSQITLIIWVFTEIGLAATHALMAVYPLMIAAGAAAFLGEKLDATRWGAIGLGFLGVLTILRPGAAVLDPMALLPLVAAAFFALYGLLTRIVGRDDGASVSFFYTGVAGAAGASLIGPFYAVPMAQEHWPAMAALCFTGAFGHFLLIKAYEHAEAAALQPYAYTQLALVTLIGVLVFGETVTIWMALGGAMIVAGGLISAAHDRRLRRGERQKR